MGNRDYMISNVIYRELKTQYCYGSIIGVQFPIWILLFAAPSTDPESQGAAVVPSNLVENLAVRATVCKSLGSASFHYIIPRFALPI
jgi:hypothetical protein